VIGVLTRCPTCGSPVIANGDTGTYEPVETACETYRKALWRIADAESGIWGRIAFEALRKAEKAS
jgi:hypothetical protein